MDSRVTMIWINMPGSRGKETLRTKAGRARASWGSRSSNWATVAGSLTYQSAVSSTREKASNSRVNR